jgi:hypothetical protein
MAAKKRKRRKKKNSAKQNSYNSPTPYDVFEVSPFTGNKSPSQHLPSSSFLRFLRLFAAISLHSPKGSPLAGRI